MAKKKFYNSLASSLFVLQQDMDANEFNELHSSLKNFFNENGEKPVEEQTSLFVNKYGSLLEMSRLKMMASINSSLTFFKVLAIVLMVIVPIIAFIVAIFS